MPDTHPPSSREGPLALTMGEPAGIGPDITLSAWRMRHVANIPPFAFIGDADILQQRAPEGDVPIEIVAPDRASDAVGIFETAIPVIESASCAVQVILGQPAANNAPAVLDAIATSVRMTHAGQTSAVVTNPIQKESLYEAGFAHPGHTEYLGALASEHWGGEHQPVMMLTGADLRVVPVTIHIPLKDVPGAMTPQLIAATIRTCAGDLRTRFGIANPRVAVAGLNPHAGEGGTIGTEDDDVIAPVIADLAAAGLDVRGPLPADTMFHNTARATYDVAICMYHDQALIPVKTLAFDTGINVTLGLPFVRTSPDHGTALDIAGSGTASAASLIEALKLASSMTEHTEAQPVSAA